MAKSNTATIIVAAVACIVFGGITWWAVDTAGGTSFSPDYSNTPNATVSGPPAYK